MTAELKTVLLLDDDASTLRGLERLLIARGYHVRTYQSPDLFFQAGPPSAPACLLLDYHFGPATDTKGLEVYAEIQRRGWCLPTVFLTAEWDAHTIVKAMRDGAADYLTKPFDPEELVRVVDRVLRESTALHLQHQRKIDVQLRASALTVRERKIIEMVVAGKLNKEIADCLNIALITVKVHRGRAMRKFGARNPAELARIASLVGIGPRT